MNRATCARTRRPAFTLVEMMVVLAIIVVLIALTGAALTKTIERQKTASTNDQLNKLQQALDAEYDRVVQKCAQDSQNGSIPPPVVTFCGGDPNRTKAVWTAFNLQRQFPENFIEATSISTAIPGYSLPPLTTFAPVQNLTSGPATIPANQESGALLYLILANKAVNGNSAMANSADDLSQAAQRQVTFNGVNGSTPFSKTLNTFSDAWGQTIGFRRWYGSQATESDVQNPPYVGNTNPINPMTNTPNLDPLDTRNLVLPWPSNPPALAFNGRNRTATVYSLGSNTSSPQVAIYGYPLRRYGN